MTQLADHRLPDARGAAQAADRQRRRQRADPRRPAVRHAHLAQSAEDGGARRHADARVHMRLRPTISRPPPDRSRATSSRRRSTRQTSLDSAARSGTHRSGARATRWCACRHRQRRTRRRERRFLSLFNGLNAVFVGIYSTPTANPLTVISDVRKVFPEIEPQLPPA